MKFLTLDGAKFFGATKILFMIFQGNDYISADGARRIRHHMGTPLPGGSGEGSDAGSNAAARELHYATGIKFSAGL